MRRFQTESDIRLINIYLIVLTILLYLFRSTVPFLKFPFLILFFGLVLYSFINYRILIFPSLKEFLRHFYLSIILLIILILSFYLSHKLYLGIFKDIINAVILIALFFLMSVFIRSKKDLKIFNDSLIRFVIFFSLLISVLLLGNFLNLFSWNNPLQSRKLSGNLSINSLSSDYNFVLLPVLFGFISVIYVLFNPLSFFKKGILNLILIVFSVTIFVSGSRRGLITFIFIIIFLLLVQLLAPITKNKTLIKIGSSSRWYLVTICVLALLSYGYIFKSSYFFKKNTLELIGSKDLNSTKVKFASSIYRYISTFNKNVIYRDLYEKIWFNGFDKGLDPDSGWGTSIHKTIYPLKGEDSDILPHDARGYMLDSTCNAYSYGGKAYSSTLIGIPDVKKGDIVTASVYCYISKDFNGDRVQFFSEGSSFGSTVSVDKYQKKSSALDDNILSDTTDEILKNTNNLFFNGNFEDSTKFWIPNADSTTHEIIETPFGKGIRVSRTNGDGGWWSLNYTGPPIIYNAGHRYQIKFNFKIEKGSELPFNIGWWVNDASQGYSAFRLPLTIRNINNGWKEASCYYKFEETYYSLPAFLNSLQDYSVVDIAKVEMLDLDRTDSISSFVDQLGLIKPEHKGIWHKYILKALCNNGKAPIYISFSKNGTSDFSSLKGYVIFAYPKFKVIRSRQDSITTSMYPTETIPGRYHQPHDKTVSDQSNLSNQSRASIIPLTFPLLTFLIPDGTDRDLIRKLTAKFISEDTTYYGYKKILVVDKISNKFIAQRVSRWQFAAQIFLKEYNWKQKVFGGGFNFLNWFGYYFEKNKTLSDYPHNPFLSVLLYSGLFGLIIYLIFLYKVIYYYIRNIRNYPIMFLFFAITFFFSFFSAGSPFDPPLMGFFMVFPFLMHYIETKKEES